MRGPSGAILRREPLPASLATWPSVTDSPNKRALHDKIRTRFNENYAVE